MIPAHDSPLAALAFDASGTKLATASEKVQHFTVQCTGPTSMWLICVWFLFSAWANTDHCRFSKCCHPLCIFHFLPGHSHSCLLNPRGTEALRVSKRSQEVDDSWFTCYSFIFWEIKAVLLRWTSTRSYVLYICITCFPTYVLLILGVWASAHWHSVWKACTCRPPATQRRSTSSN